MSLILRKAPGASFLRTTMAWASRIVGAERPRLTDPGIPYPYPHIVLREIVWHAHHRWKPAYLDSMNRMMTTSIAPIIIPTFQFNPFK